MNIAKVAGGFLGGAGKIDNIVKAAKGLLCITALLSKFKAADVRNLLGGLAGMAAAAAASIASAVVDAVTDTINGMINTALAPLRMLQGYAKSLANLIDSAGKVISRIGDMLMGVRDKLKNLNAKSLNLRDFLMNTQNCNVQAADFMNCLLKSVTNKLNKKVLSKLENPLKKVDAQLSKLHKEIAADAFKVGGLMEQYVGKNLRAAEKLSKQLEIMTR